MKDSESIGLMQEYCYMKNGLYVMFQFGTGCPYVPLTEYLPFVLEFKNNF